MGSILSADCVNQYILEWGGMMKVIQFLLLFAFIIFSNLANAVVPILLLSSLQTNESINLILKIKNPSYIANVKFSGLNNFQVLHREEGLNLYSMNDADDIYSVNLIIAPIKAESSLVSATARIDGTVYQSNLIRLIISPSQLDAYQENRQRQYQEIQKQATIIQRQLTRQVQMQQQFFESIEDNDSQQQMLQ